MAGYFGLNLREETVVQYVSEKKKEQTAREEQ